MIENIIDKLLEWKFFRYGWEDLTDDERAELLRDIQEVLNEKI
jgi:hypothetical protein